MIFDKDDFKAYDADLWNAIAKEEERQQNNIELIASENVVSKAVMAAQGSILTNKYAEGYPGRRYYGGTDVVDVVETLAIERAKEIFGAKFANVQPHSGSQANCAAYMALIEKAVESLQAVNEGLELGMPVDLLQVDLTRTWEILGEITGDAAPDELITQLFSQFCLGK